MIEFSHGKFREGSHSVYINIYIYVYIYKGAPSFLRSMDLFYPQDHDTACSICFKAIVTKLVVGCDNFVTWMKLWGSLEVRNHGMTGLKNTQDLPSPWATTQYQALKGLFCEAQIWRIWAFCSCLLHIGCLFWDKNVLEVWAHTPSLSFFVGGNYKPTQ